MSWFPIGPDFVFTPYFGSFLRLSLRNEFGQQGLVAAIEIDPTDPRTIYVVERPSNGGASVFRTRDEGRSWRPISDALHQDDPNISPTCFAINPAHPEIVYMGTAKTSSENKAAVFVSSNRGEPGSWSPRRPMEATVRKLLVDPRTAANPAKTVIYAATELGLFRSTDGGATWPPNLFIVGDVWGLEAHFPASGPAQLYAAVRGKGVFHAEDSNITQEWRNLNEPLPSGASTGLPAPGSFDGILVGLCPRNPSRIYAWLLKDEATTRTDLWTSADPKTTWTSIAMSAPPNPLYSYKVMSFAVAPNSPGDGLKDILLFGSAGISRSTDSGRTWQQEKNVFHVDQHAIAFSPAAPPPGAIPSVYIGCDGGIAKSTHYADPAYDISQKPGPFYNALYQPSEPGLWQNLNHGKQSSAVYQYASPPEAPMLSYIGVQDTGVNGGGTSLVWRGIADSDCGGIGAAVGPDGVNVWGQHGLWQSWPILRLTHWLDKADRGWDQGWVKCGDSLVAATSNCENGPGGSCLTGGVVLAERTTLSQAVSASPAPQEVQVASLAGIAVKSKLLVDPGGSEEEVTVSAVTGTGFSAVFRGSHAAGTAVAVQRAHALLADDKTSAAIVSQDFMPELVQSVSVSTVDRDVAYLWTSPGDRVFSTDKLSAAGPATAWKDVTAGLPNGLDVADIAVTRDKEVFLLSQRPFGFGAEASPLFKLKGSGWAKVKCINLPESKGAPHAIFFGKLVADPLDRDILYASNGARVFRLTPSGAAWQWTDVSEGLPGQWIYDLIARETHGSDSGPRVLLRAAVPTRGVFERDARQTEPDPPISLYVRHHQFDPGWGTPSTEGFVNPYNPAEAYWHYMCADVKVDAHEIGGPGVGNFYQTDPEGNPIPPLDHVRFEQLKDKSNNVPDSDTARVHVQVHNRSHVPSGDVTVWAAYCAAAAGPYPFNFSPSQGNQFPFWSQFKADGTIVPALPSDSKWQSVGPPQVLRGIEASEPKVASWAWTVPTLEKTGNTGHCCLAVFVHSVASPIGESERMSINEVATDNRQVGQKNLHISAPLPATPGPPGEGTAGGAGPPGGIGETPHGKHFEYVEFNNPDPAGADRISDLVFDLRRLPPGIRVTLQLTPVQTAGPLAEALVGIAKTRPVEPGDTLPSLPKIPILSALWELIVTIVCWLVNLVRTIFGRPTKPCRRPRIELPDFEPFVHEAESGARVAVEGVQLGPFGSAAALIAFETVAPLPPGESFTLDVQQWATGEKRELEGGGHYVVQVAGEKPPPEVPLPPTMDPSADREEVERLEREAEQFPTIPPFAHRLVEQRESELERRKA